MMHCLFGIHDDLHDFAALVRATVDEVCDARPLSSRDFGTARCSILLRKDSYQVELCDMKASSVVTDHTHPGTDSIELGLSGEGLLTIGGVDIAKDATPEKRERFLTGKAIRIGQDVVHGARIGPSGLVFLSIQRWKSEPRHIGENWVGTPVSSIHEKILRGLD